MPRYTVSQTTSVATTTTSTFTVFTTTTTTTTIAINPTSTAPSQPTRRSERDSDKAKGKGDNAREEIGGGKKRGDDGKQENDDDKPLPNYCAQYPKPRVSSACSCLSIPPLTTTTTSTITVTSPTPATTVVQTNFNTIVETTTTTSTITSTATSTNTICPAPTQTPGAYGIGLASEGGQFVGTIEFPTASDGNDCCLACFDPSRSSNCVAFAGGSGYCFIIVSTGGLDPSPMCPAGRIGANVYVETNNEGGDGSLGGAGPCAGPGFTFDLG